jgi:hypothetical protein
MHFDQVKRREFITPMRNLPLGDVACSGPPRGVDVLLLVALAALGATPPRADGEASHVQPTRTAKEQLGGKASDEQRVDNCTVSLGLRGPKPRPQECGDGASTDAKHWEQSSAKAVCKIGPREMLWELENFGAQIRRATAMFTLGVRWRRRLSA